METRDAPDNHQVRLALREKLRTASEFDALICDYFPSVSHLIPENADRLHKETILITCVGADAIMSTLSRYNTAHILRISQTTNRTSIAIIVVLFAVALCIFFIIMPFKFSATRHSLDMSVAANLGPEGKTATLAQKSSNRHQDEHLAPPKEQTKSNLPKTRIALEEICPSQFVSANRIEDAIYEFVPKSRPALISTGMRLVLYTPRRQSGIPPAYWGTGVTIRPDSGSRGRFVVEHHIKSPFPTVLCSLRANDRSVKNVIGQIIGSQPIRINIGSSAGAHSGDIYHILGEAITDRTANGDSLGREVIGKLRLVSTKILYSEAELLGGKFESGSYVQLATTAVEGKAHD